MSDKPREKRLADYRDLLESLEEMAALQQDSADDDEEMRTLIADAEAQLRSLAESLNAEETIEPTPGLVKVVLPAAAATELTPRRSGNDDSTASSSHDHVIHANGADREECTVVLYPPADSPRLCAPYEVLYDERDWYPCVITAVVPPAEALDRIAYRAWILGYNTEEVVFSELLRPWGAEQEEGRKNAIRSGAACHAIRPSRGLWEAATVERLTLQGTVMVTFAAREPTSGSVAAEPTAKVTDMTKSASAGLTETVELPLSHVHTGTRFFPTLRKRPQLSEEERQARRRESARRKRERVAEEKQRKADRVAQDASDWQALMGDMLGGGAGVGKKKRRF